MQNKQFSFGEKRLLAFAGKAPSNQPNELVDALKQVEGALDVQSAKDVVAQFITDAEADSVADLNEVHTRLLGAAQLAFDSNQSMLGPEAQLDKINTQLKPVLDVLGKSLTDYEKDGILELSDKQPTTQKERLNMQFRNAVDKLTSGDMADKLSAVFELWATVQEFMSHAKNGTMDDAFETDSGKQNRMRSARYAALRNELRGTTVANLLSQKQADIVTAEADVGTAKTELASKEGSLKSARDALAAENAKGDAKDALEVTRLTQDITRLEVEVQTARETLTKKEEARDQLQLMIVDLKNMEKNVGIAQKKLIEAIAAMTPVLKGNSNPAVQALGLTLEGTIVEVTENLDIALTVGGKPFPDVLGDALRKAGVTDIPKNSDMGMDASGVIVDEKSFINYMTGGEVGKAISKAAAEKITTELDGPTKISDDQKAKILESLETPNTPVEGLTMPGSGEPAVLIFAGGNVWMQQAEGGLDAKILKLDGPNTDWLDRTGSYCTGKSVKQIPEPTNEAKRNKLYVYVANGDEMEWREKTAKEMLIDPADDTKYIDVKDHNGTIITADTIKKAMDSANTWQDYNGMREVYFDGNRTLILQNTVDPSIVEVFDVDDFGNTGDATMKQKLNSYYNGSAVVAFTGNLLDGGKRSRGYEFINHSFDKRSISDLLAYHLTNDPFTPTSPDLQAAIEKVVKPPLGWQTEGVWDVHFDGANLVYQQDKPDAYYTYEFDKYIQGGGAGNWKKINGKYLDGSGTEQNIPNIATHEYDRATKEWKLDAAKAVQAITGITVNQKAGLESILNNDGGKDWSPNAVFPGYEGIRVGDKVYAQAINNPHDLWIADLQNSTFQKQINKYFDGSTKTIKNADPRFVMNYNEADRTWEEINGEESKNRKENRLSNGQLLLKNQDSGFSSIGSGESFTLQKSGVNCLDVRFNTLNHQWEWSTVGNGLWKNVSDVIQNADVPIGFTMPDVTYLNTLRTKLESVNAIEDIDKH